MKTNKELPEPMRDVMITYIKCGKETITKRGFYSNLFNNFSVPPAWRKFNGVLLPSGWGGDNLTIDQVINWEYCED